MCIFICVHERVCDRVRVCGHVNLSHHSFLYFFFIHQMLQILGGRGKTTWISKVYVCFFEYGFGYVRLIPDINKCL